MKFLTHALAALLGAWLTAAVLSIAPGPSGDAASSGRNARVLDATSAPQVKRNEDAQRKAESKSALKSPLERDAKSPLARKLRQLSVRVQELTEQKAHLEADLDAAETELEEVANGEDVRIRDPFDLDEDDWSELASEGTVKFRVPCTQPSADRDKLADVLDTDEEGIDAILAAQKRSAARTWDTVGPLCAEALGSKEIADLLGMQTCMHVVVGMSRKQKDPYASFREIADIRSGKRPEPTEDDEVSAALELLLTMTSASQEFEQDLAATFDAEDAKRIAYATELCSKRSEFGGPPPEENE
jgi:hypothetical protein